MNTSKKTLRNSKRRIADTLARNAQPLALPFETPLVLHGADSIKGAIMVETAVHHGNFVSASGWIIGACSFKLKIGGEEIAPKLVPQEREDVRAFFPHLATEKCGFSFIHNAASNAPVILEVRLYDGADEKVYIASFSNATFAGYLAELNHTLETTIPPTDLLTVRHERPAPRAESVLIVGSAPSIEKHLDRIRSFPGERWALNDAWLYLEAQGIPVDLAFITDVRFLRKCSSDLVRLKCDQIVTIDAVDLTLLKSHRKTVYLLKSLGRDGFSRTYGEVYHGCSVFFSALQTATAFGSAYSSISCCGVMFPQPARYKRVDGSCNMPEYVHAAQLNNAKNAITMLRRFGIELEIFEPESNLNFM